MGANKGKENFLEYQKIKDIIHEDCVCWDKITRKCVGLEELCGRCNFYKTQEQYVAETGREYSEKEVQRATEEYKEKRKKRRKDEKWVRM